LTLSILDANGLSRHVEEAKTFNMNRNIDIILISETHFTNKNYLGIPNYAIYTTQHPEGKAQSGTAVIIKNSIKHHELNKYEKQHLQATSIALEDWQGPFTITAVYCLPRPFISKAQFEDFYRSLGSRFIAGGNYNLKHLRWGCRLVTPRFFLITPKFLLCKLQRTLSIMIWRLQ
jgi:exonuclease III